MEATITRKQILEIAFDITSNYFKLNIKSKTRKINFVQARAFYYKMLYDTGRFSLESIGRTLKKNHATVLHSIKKLEGYCEFNPSLKAEYLSVNKMFLDSLDLVLTDSFKDVEFTDPQFLEMLAKFNELKKRYINLKALHNELIVNNEYLNKKYIKLKEFSDGREAFFDRNGYVLERIKYNTKSG